MTHDAPQTPQNAPGRDERPQPTPESTPCPFRWHNVACIHPGAHTQHTDGHAVIWTTKETRP